jgi:hypothetical protein
MQTIALGSQGLAVSQQGLGCMGMSEFRATMALMRMRVEPKRVCQWVGRISERTPPVTDQPLVNMRWMTA